MSDWTIHQGDALEVLDTLPAESVQTCVTSPPYWQLRDYGVDGQLGLEEAPEEYVANLVEVFERVRRVLRDDGTLWLNLGDTYAGSGHGGGGSCMKERADKSWARKGTNSGWRSPTEGLKRKDLVGIPWRVALALQEAGWWLRSDIIWHKPNPFPGSYTDRPTSAHEHVFLLAKSATYYYDAAAIGEPKTRGAAGSQFNAGKTAEHQQGRSSDKPRGVRDWKNKRDVWTVPTSPFPGAHFARFPPDLIRPCILAGAPEGGTVLDPFCGSGTTGAVALEHGRKFVGAELNGEYVDMANERIAAAVERAGRLDAETAERVGGGQLGMFTA